MIIDILLLIIGFVILIKGADIFIGSTSALAQNFKLSKTFIALTIVALGTSLPEFAVSIQALKDGSGEFVLGNVIGSNILNTLLIIGLSSLVHDLNVKNNTVKKEIPIMLLITLLLAILINDKLFDPTEINTFSRRDGMIVILFFGIFVYYLISMFRMKVVEEQEKPKYKIPKSLLLTVIGLIAIILGSELVVTMASDIATILGISERIIAITIIALGTSLPELVTSVTATKKGEYDLAIGNIVGSSICNIGIVLGLPVVLFGSISNLSFTLVDLITLLLSAFLLFIFASKNRNINKLEGILLLTLFVTYYIFIIFV